VTAHPVGAWVTQQARNLAATLEDQGRAVRFLVRDRDAKFVGPFDEVMRSVGARVIRTPVRAPRANAFAEGFVRTARTECLDWLLVRNVGHLERALREFVEHYNCARPAPRDRPRGASPPLSHVGSRRHGPSRADGPARWAAARVPPSRCLILRSATYLLRPGEPGQSCSTTHPDVRHPHICIVGGAHDRDSALQEAKSRACALQALMP
jgi:hypothetical protein